MGTLLDKWRSAKQLFKTTARVKKPSPTVNSVFATKTLGIEKAILKLEAAQTKGINANAKALTDWKSAALAFRVAKTSYLIVLNDTVGKEPAGADRDAYRKGIAVLKTQLTALDSTITALTHTAESSQAGQGALAIMANNLMHLTTAACDGATAYIARVKANPTPAEFNGGIQTAARDITQNIGNINNLTNRGFVFAKAQPTNLFTLLSTWANDGRQVADDATRAKVLSEIKVFEQAVAGVKRWAA